MTAFRNSPTTLTSLTLLLILMPLTTAPAQDRAPALAPPLNEIIPTSRTHPATWRYTTRRPANDWARPAFDDSQWQQGPGPFASPNTPGITIGTAWNTADIWLRREVTLPTSVPDPATLSLILFHDEDVEVFIDGIPAARRPGFVTAYEPVDIAPAARQLLKPGAKVILALHCHQTAGGQGVDVGIAVVPPTWGGYDAPPVDPTARIKRQYRDFANTQRGDAARGRALFADEQRLGCARCHSTDPKTQKIGPDLFAVGDKFPRRELIDAVLTPSVTLAVGYATTIVTTTSGDVVDGIVKDATDDAITLVAADGAATRIPTADIKDRRTSDVSMMPDGLERGLSHEEFADLIEYLATLRLPESAAVARQGMPAVIAESSRPVALVPFCEDRNRFDHPAWLGQIPGLPGAFLVAEHETGKIWLLEKSADGAERKTLFGDFHDEIRRGGATGLLGVAFHPKFRENRRYFIQHEKQEGNRLYALVSEKLAAPDFKRDSGQPSRTIARYACATDVHSGGGIEFGPDGYLYIAMGDTGPQGDPEGHGQDLKRPLGKVLRIDIDRSENGNAYAIPADNPFRNRPDVLPEIWAYGFREPWRFSFDPVTADLWIGDVGQDQYEEVSIVRKGENHGWNVYEGFEPFSARYRRQGEKFIPPVFAYSRRFGNSITGGYVYRADKASPFYGIYICADYTSRRIWGIRQHDRALQQILQVATAPQRVASFAKDEAGNLYAVGYEGTIYRLDFTGATFEPASK